MDDGTKVRANASKHKAMSYDRMTKADAEFATVVKDWLTAAKCADLSEDSRFKDAKGKDDHEDPPWISTA